VSHVNPSLRHVVVVNPVELAFIWWMMLDRSDASRCVWCGASLTEAEIFRFELRMAGWRKGGLLAPENPDFEINLQPLSECSDCDRSINDNYDAIRREEQYTPSVVFSYVWSALLIVLLLSPFVACVWVILWQHIL